MKKINIFTLFLVVIFLNSLSIQAQEVFLSSIAPKGASFLNIQESDLIQNFDRHSSDATVAISSNLAYNIKTSDNWCKAELQAGTNNLKISVIKNDETDIRDTEITLSAKDNKTVVIKVNQLGSNPGVLVKEDAVKVVDDNLTFSLEITSNVDFSIHLPKWITGPTPAPSVGTHKYQFEAEALLVERSSRTGTITIKAIGLEDIKISVTQIFNGYPRFAVISDVHFGNNQGEGPNVKVPKALKNIFNKTPKVDALFVVGDLTDNGTAAQYQQLLKVFNDKTVVPEGMPVYYMMGNHDNYSGAAAAENYSVLGQPLHQYIEIKGYPFITISMSGSSTDGYGVVEQQFLRTEMEKAAAKYPGKPIFVMVHVPVKNTVYGSNPYEAGTGGGSWGTDKFLSILNQYPQAVVFSGHSHFPLGDPRSIHQDKFTSVNDGSTTYSEIEPALVNAGIHPEKYAYVTEGLIVNVDKNMNIEMERWDTYRDTEILPRWNINAPYDGSNFAQEYKGRTGGEAPKFAAEEKPVVSEVEEESCKVTFKQATDDELVHHYVIDILDKTDKVVATFSKFSEFYLNLDMPLSFTISFAGVPNGSTLKARVTALDSYKNKSTPILSEEFTTGEYKPDPSVTKPVADILDVEFRENGVAIDKSPLANTILTGATLAETYLNETYNLWTAKFTKDNTKYYKVDYKNNQQIKDAFSNGFSYEALYMVNNTSSTMSPISAQEGGGAGIEHTTTFEFWAHIGGAYKTLKGGSVTPKKFQHVIAIYDKTNAKLVMYVDGTKVGEMAAAGNFAFPGNTAAQWIAIAGDAGTGSTVQSPMDGEIVFARMYGKAVSRDEVYRMYEAVKGEEPEEPEEPETLIIPNNFPESKLVGLWEFNDSADPGKATKGAKAILNGSAAYEEVDGIGTIRIVKDASGVKYQNCITIDHGLTSDDNPESDYVRNYCLVMDAKMDLDQDYTALYRFGTQTDADIFARGPNNKDIAFGAVGLGGAGLNYSHTLLQKGWNRIVINAQLDKGTESTLSIYVCYPNGTINKYERIGVINNPNRLSIVAANALMVAGDNDGENGNLNIAQLAILNTYLTDEELEEVLVSWE